MKICIVANNAYGALTGEKSGHIGGVERQAALFAKWFVSQGHQVSVITWNEGGEKKEVINGIEIITLCKVSAGLPIVRFFHPRWTSLVSALKKANADIYYHNCLEYISGQVALWCKVNKKPFIYATASDMDCRVDLLNQRSIKEREFFKFGLRKANLIIAQTHKQKKLLKENFNLESIVIPMPGTPPHDYDENTASKEKFNNNSVIWVGRICHVKRFEWIVSAAKQLPNINFKIAGPLDTSDSKYVKLLEEVGGIDNISYLGKVHKNDLHQYYKQAAVLCCTSIVEGFPNTFLEAWSYQTPVVTTFDPDNIVENQKLGIAVTEYEQLIDALISITNNKDKRILYGQNARKYYERFHTLDSVMKKFEAAFSSTLN